MTIKSLVELQDCDGHSLRIDQIDAEVPDRCMVRFEMSSGAGEYLQSMTLESREVESIITALRAALD